MKHSDLQAGEIYTVKGSYLPCLLLSTDIHEQYLHHDGGATYKAAPGCKPRRDPSKSWYVDKRNFGLLALEGSRERLETIEPAAFLAALADGTLDKKTTSHFHLKLITNFGTIEGTCDEVAAEEERRRQVQSEYRAEARDRYNEIIDALNTVLDHPLWRPENDAPWKVELSLTQAKQIADILTSGTVRAAESEC